MRVLVVDDDDARRAALVADVRGAGFDVTDFDRPEPTLEELQHRHVDVVITGFGMPPTDGVNLLRDVRATSPETDVIVTTANGSIGTAIEAMRHGAYDYLAEPFSCDEMIVVLRRLERERRLRRENEAYHAAVAARSANNGHVIAASPAMATLMDQVRRVAGSSAHVLLVGETGTGKDLIAQTIHNLSARADRPFVKIACATYSPQLLESELFGHERGAFTGAEKARAGRFELGHEGTVYLDDLDDIPIPAQTRLLHVIEERVIERVGGSRVIPVDVRVIASTKVDLSGLVSSGEFRADLYHRMNVVSFHIPPLRERPDDIGPLLRHFCESEGQQCACHVQDEILAILKRYRWPGNVRELRNVVERWKLLKQTPRTLLSDLPPEIRNGIDGPANPKSACPDSFEEAVAAFERRLLNGALKQTGGNKSRAAQLLKLKPSTFRNKLSQHGLNGTRAAPNVAPRARIGA